MMKTIYRIGAAFLVVATSMIGLSGAAYANGGPVEWTSVSPSNGLTVQSTRQEDIALREERLDIKVTGVNTYHVRAEYRLENVGGSQSVTFGVPLRGLPDFYDYESPTYGSVGECLLYSPGLFSREYCISDMAENAEKHRAHIMNAAREGAENLSITFNGTPLDCSLALASESETLEEDLGNPRLRIRAWCVTDAFVFEAGSSGTVTMEYDADLEFQDLIFSKSPFTVFDNRRLIYDFWPAAYWQGTVGSLSITLDPGLFGEFINIASPDGYTSGDVVRWELRDVDFNRMRRLHVFLGNNLLNELELMSWNAEGPEYARQFITVSASSTLEPQGGNTYVAANMLDGDGVTAWCEGSDGPGIGERIRVELGAGAIDNSKSCELYGIGITPGYAKSQKAYASNTRIKQVRISQCGEDSGTVHEISLSEDYRTSTYLIENAYVGGRNRIFDFIGASKCFEMEIIEVDEGKFPDACISELSVIVNCG